MKILPILNNRIFLYANKNQNIRFNKLNKDSFSYSKNNNKSYNQNNFDSIIFQGKKLPVYAIDYDGNYLKFSTQTEASKVLGIDKNSMSRIIAGERKTVPGLIFTTPDKIETEDENGNIKADNSKIAKILDNAFKNKKKPIYVISPDGSYETFYTQYEAGDGIGVSHQAVNLALSEKIKCLNGKVIAYAKDIETRLEDGSIVADNEKIGKILNKKLPKRDAKAIYAISLDGEYEKFASIRAASEALEISVNKIDDVLRKACKTTGKYTFVYAEEIEQADKKGDVIINPNDIKRITDNCARKKGRAIYCIDYTGKYKRYPSILYVSKELNMYDTAIKRALEEHTPVKGYSFAYADEIEIPTGKNKETIVSKTFIGIFQRKANSKFFYGINKDGEYKKFFSIKDASKECNVPAQNLYYILANKVLKPHEGIIFIHANAIETKDEEGNITVSKKAVQKLLENFAGKNKYETEAL